MKPKVKLTNNLLRLYYELPHRVYSSKVYPLLSPNGSNIIVCGHGQGLFVLWRGGRSFKSQPKAAELKPVNDANKDTVMILESDNEEPPTLSNDTPVFDEEEVQDFAEPYPPLVQTLDLPIGVAVLHISFPNLPTEPAESAMKSLPPLLSDRLVVAIACSDFSIRVLTLPLVPPSPQSKMRPDLRNQTPSAKIMNDRFGEQMLVVSGGNGHQSIPRGVSVTATARSLPPAVGPQDQARNRSYSASRPRSQGSSPGTDHSWDLLIASHSARFSGLLLIHKVAIVADGSKIDTTSAEHSVPWQMQSLASPAVSIDFNPSIYPSPRHSLLLIAEAKGVVRILDCLSQHESRPEGCWLISLYSAFQPCADSAISRKHILGAQWCRGGKAVMVLLADGEWGLWNIENAGPKAKRGTEVTESISGTLLTTFDISGWVSTTRTSKSSVKNASGTGEKSHGLAPTTPGTRRVRQESLFTGRTAQLNGVVHGGLSISSTRKNSIQNPDDESILLWHGDDIAILPSLFKYWQNAVKGAGNLFGTDTRGQLKRIGSSSLGDEARIAVSLFPEPYPSWVKSRTLDQNEILITTERGIIIMATPIAEPRATTLANSSTTLFSADQHLLALGELDVNGMDRVLAGMSNGSQAYGDHGKSNPVKKVGFLNS
ncbi:hypothetical protein MMC07_005748 [Pseudocyphellaria aurata]|nr:hypothetical protein [Pseudocyphellaria aurata]